MISKLVNFIFGGESEFAKKWMARVTIAVLFVFICIIPLLLGLIFLHLKFGLSRQMISVILTNYIDLLKITVSGYFAVFIGYMGKAFLAKREEENNKIKMRMNDLDDENDECAEEDGEDE